MSADELTLARQRVPDPAVKLHLGLAQHMAFIADRSIDVVLCHWGLTLMDPVEQVLAEVRRVLRPEGILAAIVAPNVIGRIDDAQVTRVQQDIRGIENALKFYRLDNFAYPTSEQGLEALVTKPADPNIRNWKGAYLDRLPKDPWGNQYLYLNPGNNAEIDIYTLGRDGRPGGEGEDADIGNWELE